MRLALAALLALGMCATAPGCAIRLSDKAKKVTIAERGRVSDCSFLGVVTGKAAWFAKGNENAEHDAVNKAAERGGTHIRILHRQGKGKKAEVEGEVYECFDVRPSDKTHPSQQKKKGKKDKKDKGEKKKKDNKK